MLAVCDELVGMGAPKPTGAPTALIESRDAVVVDWATETFESYWSRAEPVEPPG